MAKMKIAFIGLGEMGKGMAKNLATKGFPLTVVGHVRREPVEELLALGAREASSPKEAAAASDVTISIARTTQQNEEVIYGKGSWEGRGVLQGIRPGSVIVISATIEPSFCQKLAAVGREKGVVVLDAPVSGGYPRSNAGTLTIPVGGDKATFERCRPVFAAMGTEIFYMGGPGTAQICKLVNNYMMNITAFATSEGIAIGLKAGLDLRAMLEVIKVSSGNSSIVERYDLQVKRERERKEREPGVMPRYEKTMKLAIKLAEDLGVPADLGKFILKMDPAKLYPTEPPK